MVLILLTAEFTIFLFFLMSYIQLYENFSFLSKNFNIKFLVLIMIIFNILITSNISTFNFFNFYSSVCFVISSDFFIIYYMLFEVMPLLTIIFTLIISIFSLFFIALYFNLKLIKILQKKKIKNIFFLRKQSILKQTNFKSTIYTFQN